MVINCAAISVPRACEIDPDTANAINVPSSLVKWLQTFKQNNTLLIHLSTDQGKPILSQPIYCIGCCPYSFSFTDFQLNCYLCFLSLVYEGEKSFYKEEDIAIPVNVYGKTKLAAEKFIAENFPNFAILRSSIIYGPQTLSPVPKSLPVQVHLQYADLY